MGYGPVHRYLAGKADWSAAGWEREGRLEEKPFLLDVVRRDIPRCCPDERLAEVRRRVDAAGWDRCVVVEEHGVVLGMLSGSHLDADGQLTAELAMQPGPSTFRPSISVGEMAGYMQEKNVQFVLVTDSDGVLIGGVDRRTVEEAARG
jgi:CBS domain-containing protein